MDVRARCILAAACGVLLLAASADAAEQKTRPASYPTPEIKKDCTTCHVAGEPPRAGNLKRSLSALCLDCHPDRRAPAEHKVDMVPSMKVTGLPLADGKMTCATCHDPHRNLHGKLLRVNPRDLCLVCHPL